MDDDRRKYQPLIDLDAVPSRLLRAVLPLVGPALSRALGVLQINDMHARAVVSSTPETLWSSLVKETGARYEIADEDIERIPTSGPVVVVANHPLGGLDGIILGDVLRRRRGDSRLMANFLLKRIIHSEHHMFFVDPFPRGDAAIRASLLGLRDSLKHLKQGGLLGVFPGNRVSHYQWDTGMIADGPWVPNIAALIRRAQATVVPVYIEGENSALFNLAGMVHPLLRTLLLPRELIRQTRHPKPVRLHVGTPMPYAKLKRFESDEHLARFLRASTYVMGNRPERLTVTKEPEKPVQPVAEPLAEKIPNEELQEEIARLPAECRLLVNGDYEVYIARARQLPKVLQEIGRGREESFRFAGGGTGKALDLAPQDDYYHHLFLWHAKDKTVIGAYRVGLSDEIIATRGPGGLICTGLFDLKPEFLTALNPGIELGRSYVLPEYMRNYNSLLLLWAGIFQFVARNPRYRCCFGSVGISQGDEYAPASRTLIVDYMKDHLSHPTLSQQVRSRSPFYGTRLTGLKEGEISGLVQSLDDVSILVSSLEPDGKGVPVLIKHYARLNARLLSFGVWTDHSNAVVGFIVVDLATADPKFLRRYMGDAGYAKFMAYHGLKSPQPAEAV